METAAFFAKAPPPKARGCRGGGGVRRGGDHGGRPGGAARRSDAAAGARGARRAGVAHPGVRLGAQSLRRDGAGAGRPGIARNVCADALLGDPQYGVLVSPLTYGYAPAAQRTLVYSELAEQHGKMVCIAWQTEWQEGPACVEAERVCSGGAVPFDERLLRRACGVALARGQAARPGRSS